ncbi:YqaE/Pmp3 family membrane protein [uncultured Nostoc sp.]|uniref:YqaE/Pmp3 family membrane protein n=1 Tax=uncultured Nostoc sp. TaxID=340711 RepID=UPI0035C9A5E5
MSEKLNYFIYFCINCFLPPIGVLLTLSIQKNPPWHVLLFNLVLTIFGWFLGSIHAVWVFVDYQNERKSSEASSKKNAFLKNLRLNDFQTIVSIIGGIVAIIVGIKGLIFGVNVLSGNQTPISSNIPEKSSYVCSLKPLRYKLKYKDIPSNLRDTPEKDDNNIRGKLKSENQLIYLASSGKWYYVCVEGEKVYGWVYSETVIKQN